MTWFRKAKINELEQSIRFHSNAHDVPFALVAAIIWQESRGEPLAHRYEDAFYARYIESKSRTQLLGHVPASIPTLSTEKRDRAYSWGLMQIMGQTARELGFKADNLTELLDIETNLDTGCILLARLIKKHEEIHPVLKAYNGSESYAVIVEASMQDGSYTRLFI
jgi:soluble lytic murein transglycosylase-like protein